MIGQITPRRLRHSSLRHRPRRPLPTSCVWDFPPLSGRSPVSQQKIRMLRPGYAASYGSSAAPLVHDRNPSNLRGRATMPICVSRPQTPAEPSRHYTRPAAHARRPPGGARVPRPLTPPPSVTTRRVRGDRAAALAPQHEPDLPPRPGAVRRVLRERTTERQRHSWPHERCAFARRVGSWSPWCACRDE